MLNFYTNTSDIFVNIYDLFYSIKINNKYNFVNEPKTETLIILLLNRH